ncbi:MAG: histidine kinase dimerization/phospho-acceptor domain-containing protein, partial [Chthoniobacteraceae bacterium]
MTPHEFRPSQVRALLLLLVIVPLIPTVLMIRFMVDSVDDERTAAFERLSALYQQTLSNANATLARNVADQKTAISADEARRYFQGLFDRDVLVRVIDNEGKPVSGTSLATGAPVAQISLRELGRPWSVQVFFVDSEALNVEQRQQFRGYLWIVGTVVIGILAFALAGVLTVSRQLELRDLRSTAVATVAHELRTPLASMRMLVDTLREGRFRNEQQLREYLELIAGENDRL